MLFYAEPAPEFQLPSRRIRPSFGHIAKQCCLLSQSFLRWARRVSFRITVILLILEAKMLKIGELPGPLGCSAERYLVSSSPGLSQPKAIEYMAKRRGNPNWGKPEPIGPVVPTVTSFELVVKEFKLTPDQYVRSTRLREWARRNRNSKYIPEALLEAWGFEIESTL